MIAGGIIIWSGAIVDIPDGYALCDGNNGTPDLRNLFVVGSGDTYAPGENNDSPGHSHLFTGDGHTHTLADSNEILDNPPAGHHGHDTDPVAASGTTDNSTALPPYYSLSYIMKL